MLEKKPVVTRGPTTNLPKINVMSPRNEGTGAGVKADTLKQRLGRAILEKAKKMQQ